MCKAISTVYDYACCCAKITGCSNQLKSTPVCVYVLPAWVHVYNYTLYML